MLDWQSLCRDPHKERKRIRTRRNKSGTEVFTTYPRLALGGEEDVKTLDGEIVSMTISSESQVDSVLRIAGKGFPRTNGNVRGDLFVRVRMDVPKRTTEEEKELLRKLDDEAGTKSKKKNIFKK